MAEVLIICDFTILSDLRAQRLHLNIRNFVVKIYNSKLSHS